MKISSNSRNLIRALLRWGCVLCLSTLAIGGFSGCGKSGETSAAGASSRDRYFTVERGDFPITVLARGQLDAIKNYNLSFGGSGKMPLVIEQIVEDRAELKEGDPVLTFDREPYDERLIELQEELQDEQVAFETSKELRESLHEVRMITLYQKQKDENLNVDLFLDNLSVRRDETLSRLTEATNSYQLAQDELRKYRNLDYRSLAKQKQADMDAKEELYYDELTQLETSNEALAEARLKDDSTQDKAQRNVAVAEKKANSAFANWETARKAYRQFKRYDHPQKLQKLIINAEKTELDLKRAFVKAESEKVQDERNYRKYLRDKQAVDDTIAKALEEHPEDIKRLTEEHKTKMRRLEKRIAEVEKDIENLTIKAPIAGVVTIGNPSQSRPRQLVVGDKVSSREIVGRIPDVSKFLIRCDIPEVYRSRIDVDQPVLLKNAALPDLVMRGKVQKIAAMSTPIVFWNERSPRIYKTVISTDSSDPDLSPGMTVEVEIQVEDVEDALYVPVEAVYSRDGNSYCRVKTDFSTKEVEVQTGRASYSLVEITGGLEEGDQVFLHGSEDSPGAS